VFETLTECLGRSSDVTRVGTHLLAVDTACAGLHRGRTVGVPTTLEYYKISGAAGSPLASGRGELGAALPTFRSLRSSETGIDPNAKLSGNSLGNFSAFVAPRFRANDWMWGRMDAAAGLVDILLRPAYLRPDAVKAIEVAVKEPFYTVEDEKLRASGEVVCEELWSANAGIVEAEIQGLTAESDLAQTRRLLTARWQLEIFLYEAAAMCIQPLQPGGKGEVLPPLRAVNAGTPDALPAARANVATVMASYEDSPRRVSDVWGQRKTTALGIKVARAAAVAVVPDGGVLNAVKRTALAAPLMILVAAALARGGFLVAISVLVNVLLVPRLDTSAAVAALVVLGFGALWLFRTHRRPVVGVAALDHGVLHPCGLRLRRRHGGGRPLGLQRPFAVPRPLAVERSGQSSQRGRDQHGRGGRPGCIRDVPAVELGQARMGVRRAGRRRRSDGALGPGRRVAPPGKGTLVGRPCPQPARVHVVPRRRPAPAHDRCHDALETGE